MAKLKRKKTQQSLSLKRENYLILTGGIVTIFLGYLIMALGSAESPVSLTVAPIILIIAYLIIVPLAIWYGRSR